MATLPIVFIGADDATYAPADNVAGGNFTSRRSSASLLANAWYCASDAVWSCDVDPVSDNFSAQVVFDNVDSNARGITMDGTGTGNGFLFIGNNANLRVFAMASWALSGSPLATYTTTFATGAELNIDVTQSTGTYVVKNGATTIGTFVNTTYTSGIKAGLTSRTNGRIRSFTLTYTPSRTVNSITDPIVLGSEISTSLTGYTTPTSVTGGGMSATGLSYGAGTLTATWPALSESLVPTVALPATGVTITVTEAGGSATTTSNINLPAGYAATSFSSVVDDPRYLGGNIAITDGWRAYIESNQAGVGDVEILSNGQILADNSGTFVMYLHKFGSDNTVTQYNITINEAGEIVVVDIGYNLSDVLKITLQNKGFSGTNSEMYLAWLKANGASSLAIQDCEKEYLIARSITFTTIQDGWRAYFIGKGYSGALPEMWKTYLLNGAPL